MVVGKDFKIQWEDSDDQDELPESSQRAELVALIEADTGHQQSLQQGAKVSGTIVSFSPDGRDVLVDLGNKHIGIIPRTELTEASLQRAVGDTIEAFVISRKQHEVLLGLSMTNAMAELGNLESAMANKVPVRGKITKVNKGGFEAQVYP